MATIVRGTIPTEQFALHHTLERLPEVKIECERIVLSGDETILPLLWARDTELEEIVDALEADPSVESFECLSEFEDEYLLSMTWIDRVHLLVHLLTSMEATILDAHGSDGNWYLRILYPDRSNFSDTHRFADERGLTFDVLSVREMEGEPAGRYGLTDAQYETLILAVKRGYFEVPRTVTLAELAEECDVSHQALSERIRRGTGALIEDTLMVGAFDDDGD
ncbi:helix-turn-helix domain-containing protein [Halorarius litoreus]|uniref:helix-turn-helix domain-containing protein n=1 Tax=Halorarius litoreus TaxID=2962676 RepID=UPI0020CCC900|nr:helix-turn-helix domain-containing protein [Halorarius litoreus]